jgi:hypothetical protein
VAADLTILNTLCASGHLTDRAGSAAVKTLAADATKCPFVQMAFLANGCPG